jgi:hypothetical protein
LVLQKRRVEPHDSVTTPFVALFALFALFALVTIRIYKPSPIGMRTLQGDEVTGFCHPIETAVVRALLNKVDRTSRLVLVVQPACRGLISPVHCGGRTPPSLSHKCICNI